MGVIQAKIQTVEDIYRLVRTAVVSKRPIRAIYHGRDRWFCPHRLGRNHEGQIRVLCYQYDGESVSGLQSSRLTGELALHRAGETQQSGVAQRCMAHSVQPFPPADLRR